MAAIVLFFFDMIFFGDFAYAMRTADDHIATFATMEGAMHFGESRLSARARNAAGAGLKFVHFSKVTPHKYRMDARDASIATRPMRVKKN